jgi:tight adherence protein C
MDLANLVIMRGQWVIFGGYLLMGLGIFLFARMLLLEEESRAAEENLTDSQGKGSTLPFAKLGKPVYRQYILPYIRGKKNWDDKRIVYRRLLVSAGLKDEMNSDEFIAYKFFLVLFFPIIGFLLQLVGVWEMDTTGMGATMGAGWFYPDMYLKSKVKQRHKEVLKSLPFIVDLLALSTEAGLDFVGAIGKVVEKARPSPLVDELGQVLKEIKVGSSRSDALREMSLRVNLMEVNSFIAILISTDKMGGAIGKILRQQSEQIRAERLIRAEKEGAKAAGKIMIPLVLFILPAVLAMIGGPFVLGMLYPSGN